MNEAILVNESTHHFYGRRKAKGLTNLRKKLLDENLSKYGFLVVENKKIHPSNFFPIARKGYALEIGFGSGDNLFYQATQNPLKGYIGIDPFINGVAHLVKQIVDHKIDNIRMDCYDAQSIIHSFHNASFDEIFILFPDPWPKKRHHKRRLVTARFIERCAEKLTENGCLIIATDHKDYEKFIMKEINNQNKLILDKVYNTEFERPNFIPITKYEKKALEKNVFSKYIFLKFGHIT